MRNMALVTGTDKKSHYAFASPLVLYLASDTSIERFPIYLH